MVTIVIHSKFDHETKDIRIGLNIEIALNIVNQSTHHIAQDIIFSHHITQGSVSQQMGSYLRHTK
jgi:hypothetical protein